MKKQLLHITTEVIIVVIGLLIAFQIDRWRENYKERDLERKMLSEIKISLEFDVKDLEQNIRFHKRSLASHDSIIKKLQLNEYDTLMASHIRYLYYDLLFTPNLGSYESLKSFGINLITNDSIRTQLPHLYEYSYRVLTKIEEEIEEGPYFNKYYQMLLNNFDEFNIYETKEGVRIKSKPKDYRKLQRDSEFQILLSLERRSHKVKLAITEYTIKKVRDLIVMIDKEVI